MTTQRDACAALSIIARGDRSVVPNDTEYAAGCRLTDWLVRTIAPQALASVGLYEEGSDLISMEPIVSPETASAAFERLWGIGRLFANCAAELDEREGWRSAQRHWAVAALLDRVRDSAGSVSYPVGVVSVEEVWACLDYIVERACSVALLATQLVTAPVVDDDATAVSP